MIGHQRDILATLGIDLWIPRAEPCQPHQPAIWRDQSQPEVISEIILPELKVEAAPMSAPLVSRPVPTPVPVEQIAEQTPPAVVPVEALRELVHVEPFSLQAISLVNCTLVIDASTLNEAAQLLWSNIQRAVTCEFAELNWPFPWVNVEDGRGVESYIQGFMDAMSHEKNIIFLGKVPHYNHSQVIQLASLQNMLEHPILKKRLWQFMQS